MTETTQKIGNDPVIDQMFKVGAHFAYSRSRRHPSAVPFIFGAKNRVEIFDLEKTKASLETAKNFAKKMASEGKQILFVGGKNEARDAVLNSAKSADLPYVAGRWIGGTITNFGEIRGRVERLLDLTSKREKGELAKYTKMERLLIDREIERLDKTFAGLIPMKGIPKAIFVVDSKREKIAVAEARKAGVQVIALSSSDCDISDIDFPISANDSSVGSIRFFVNEIAEAYKSGKVQNANIKM
ncbi:MAG: 30S ribosomal protein S2 [Candidatus Paceibacterota bacterium]|jgi:small subunit ribosomal protein S2